MPEFRVPSLEASDSFSDAMDIDGPSYGEAIASTPSGRQLKVEGEPERWPIRMGLLSILDRVMVGFNRLTSLFSSGQGEVPNTQLCAVPVGGNSRKRRCVTAQDLSDEAQEDLSDEAQDLVDEAAADLVADGVTLHIPGCFPASPRFVARRKQQRSSVAKNRRTIIAGRRITPLTDDFTAVQRALVNDQRNTEFQNKPRRFRIVLPPHTRRDRRLLTPISERSYHSDSSESPLSGDSIYSIETPLPGDVVDLIEFDTPPQSTQEQGEEEIVDQSSTEESPCRGQSVSRRVARRKHTKHVTAVVPTTTTEEETRIPSPSPRAYSPNELSMPFSRRVEVRRREQEALAKSKDDAIDRLVYRTEKMLAFDYERRLANDADFRRQQERSQFQKRRAARKSFYHKDDEAAAERLRQVQLQEQAAAKEKALDEARRLALRLAFEEQQRLEREATLKEAADKFAAEVAKARTEQEARLAAKAKEEADRIAVETARQEAADLEEELAAQLEAARIAVEKEEEEKRQEQLRAAAAAELKKQEEAELKHKKEAERKAASAKPPLEIATPLDDNWAAKVDDIINAPGSLDQVVAKSKDNNVDLRLMTFTRITADGDDGAAAWLDDEAVNGFLAALCDAKNTAVGWVRASNTPPPFAFYNSAWWTTVTRNDSGIRAIHGWSRRKKIGGLGVLQTQCIFFPVNTGSHWTIMVISGKDRTIDYYDSLGGSGEVILGWGRAWLQMELRHGYEASEWSQGRGRSSRQNNSSDCGVFACYNALAQAQGLTAIREVTAAKMPAARRQLAAILLNGGFVNDFELE